MNTYLAYKSNRTYVFQDYIWKDDYYPWANHPKKPWQPRTPLNALISGPSAGGAWEVHDPFPRSISDRFLEQVCPTADRRIINTREVKPAIYWEPSGKKIFDTWHKLLSEAPERCIEIQPASRDEDGVGQTFDLWFWGLGKANDFWEEFRDSAVSKLLGTSPVVQSAVDRNEYLMRGKGKPPMGASSDPYDRMLAIHIRRGDYEAACKHFARWNSTFYSWNLLDLLPDHFVHPVGWDTDPEETLRTYITHCYPTATFILDKIRSAREAYYKAAKPGQVRFLDTVYILTNDKTEWIKGVIKALRSDGWYHIVTTEELELDSHQKDVGMAVDMDFGRKAAVFIGNGVSFMAFPGGYPLIRLEIVVLFHEQYCSSALGRWKRTNQHSLFLVLEVCKLKHHAAADETYGSTLELIKVDDCNGPMNELLKNAIFYEAVISWKT